MSPAGSRRRVLLKISGESLGSPAKSGFDADALDHVAQALGTAWRAGVEIAVVLGGGNFLRGATLPAGVDRASADHMGMLGTLINGIAVRSVLERDGVAVELLSALPVRGAVEPYGIRSCRSLLSEGRLVLLAGGTGNPYFTTDTCASLRAVEIGAQVLLKGTKVDGVYSADPLVDPKARLFKRISYEDVLAQQLKVMDSTSVALAMEHRLPIVVFNMLETENIPKAIAGEEIGTMVVP